MKARFLLLTLFPCLVGAFPISVEHAVTQAELAHGLAGRHFLPENHGMTFNFADEKHHTFWSYGCLIDLDLAFLNEEQQITEIYHLRAYPEKLDTADNEEFFHQRAIVSRFPAKYALEMGAGWFERHSVQVGDQITWSLNCPKAEVTLQVSS